MRSSLGRDFNLLWAGQSSSLLGNSLFVVAMPWEVYTLTHSTASTAFIAAVQIAPFALLGLVGGVIADRSNRRRTLIVCDLSAAVTVASLTVLVALHVIELWTLLVAALVLGSIAAIFDASWASITPQIVNAEQLSAANGRLEGSSAGTAVIGPTLSGALISASGSAIVFGFDGLTFVLGALSSTLVRYQATAAAGRNDSKPSMSQMAREGAAYLVGSSVLLPLTAALTALAIANGALVGLLVPLLRGSLRYSGFTVGAIYSAGAVGWLLASILVSRRTASNRLSRWNALAIGVAMLGAIALGFGSMPVINAAGLAAFDGGVYYFLITVVTYRQRIVPQDILGRVHALARSLANLGTPLGAVIGGILTNRVLPTGAGIALLCSAPLGVSIILTERARRAQHSVPVTG